MVPVGLEGPLRALPDLRFWIPPPLPLCSAPAHRRILVAPVKGPPRNQHVTVLAPGVGEVSLLQDYDSVLHVPSPEVHAHCRPRPRPPRAPFAWAVLCPSLWKLHPIRPLFLPPRGCVRPCPPSLPCLPVLCHAVGIKGSRRHLLPTVPTRHLLSLPLSWSRPSPRHYMRVRCLRPVPRRAAWSARHADRFSLVCLHPHPIKQPH